MERTATRNAAPLLLTGFGTLLLLFAALYHLEELLRLGSVVGPLVALLLDGVPALILAGGGFWLRRSGFTEEAQWRVFMWSIAGGAVFLLVMFATLVVRLVEGRAVAEPVFPLLVAVGVGALAGLIAGVYAARSRVAADRAQRFNQAMVFVNRLLRHDLQNDLGVIRSWSELMAERRESENGPELVKSKADEALDRIETTRTIAATLLEEHELERIDIAAISAEMADKFDKQTRVTVHTDIPNQAFISATEAVESVVDNILENAVEHNDAENPQVWVTIMNQQNTVTLVVEDNGPGIPDEQFDETAGDSMGSQGGGLQLVQTLVDAIGGTVRIQERDPRGTSVRIDFQRASEK